MLRYIENAAPAYEPGTKTGYHALTFGYILGGIVEAVDGRHIKDFLRDEISRPLGIEEEMMFGLPEAYDGRATSIDIGNEIESSNAMPPDCEMIKALPTELWYHVNSVNFRRSCNPSANGFFSARALAKMYGALANGGSIEGVKLVSPKRITEMSQLTTSEYDIVIDMARAKGRGFFLNGLGADASWGSRGTCFGHPGAGGSFAYADPEVGLSIAMTLNRMYSTTPGEVGRADILFRFIRKELGVE
jgi:CubicO group peptidase (beta-lactamase class C family)